LILNVLNDAGDYNVIVQISENKNIKEFHAYSVILRVHSPYFKVIFHLIGLQKKMT